MLWFQCCLFYFNACVSLKFLTEYLTFFNFRSLVDQQPPEHHIPDQPTTYEVVSRGSQKGKDILVASDGYSYVVKVILN